MPTSKPGPRSQPWRSERRTRQHPGHPRCVRTETRDGERCASAVLAPCAETQAGPHYREGPAWRLRCAGGCDATGQQAIFNYVLAVLVTHELLCELGNVVHVLSSRD